MKKIIFGLIAFVLVANLSFGQDGGCGYDCTKTVTITTKFMIASITDM